MISIVKNAIGYMIASAIADVIIKKVSAKVSPSPLPGVSWKQRLQIRKPTPKGPTLVQEPEQTPAPEQVQLPPQEQELGDIIAQFIGRVRQANTFAEQTLSHKESFAFLRYQLEVLKPYMRERESVVQNLVAFIDKAFAMGSENLPQQANEFVRMIGG